MLLKADVAGPGWTDERIADAFDSRPCTVEKLRERFVTEGFTSTLDGKRRDKLRLPSFSAASKWRG